MARLLTRKRAKWAQNRDVIFRGKPLRGSVSVETRYVNDLERHVTHMLEATRKGVKSIFSTPEASAHFAQDASIGSLARITMNKLEKQFTEVFKNTGRSAAKKMVRGTAQQSKSTLHSSLKELSGGLSIKTGIINTELKDITKATIAENVDLIKTIPEQYFTQVRGAVMRSIAQPNTGGLDELIKRLDKMLDARAKQIRNKARNLALDQTRKAYNNINAARMKDVGLTQFEWVHSGGGQEPRPLHRDVLNGNIYSFDDLPIIEESTGERGIPGQAINCKCTMAPVLEMD